MEISGPELTEKMFHPHPHHHHQEETPMDLSPNVRKKNIKTNH